MKLYTEEQIRELLSNMLLTTEQVESILKELKPQDPAPIDNTTIDKEKEDINFMYKWIREKSGK